MSAPLTSGLSISPAAPVKDTVDNSSIFGKIPSTSTATSSTRYIKINDMLDALVFIDLLNRESSEVVLESNYITNLEAKFPRAVGLGYAATRAASASASASALGSSLSGGIDRSSGASGASKVARTYNPALMGGDITLDVTVQNLVAQGTLLRDFMVTSATPTGGAAPSIALTYKILAMTYINNTGTTAFIITPKNVNDYFNYLNLDDRQKKLLADAAKTYFNITDATKDNIIDKIKATTNAQKFFFGSKSSLNRNTREPDVNPDSDLSLLLLGPVSVQKAILRDRQIKTKAQRARPNIRAVMGLPFGNPTGINIQVIRRTGGAMIHPSSFEYPIEMRGGGYDIAMHGGLGLVPYAQVGLVAPISDQLESAYGRLASILNKKGKTINSDVDIEVKSLIKKLKDAEDDVKRYGKELDDSSNFIKSGDVDDSSLNNVTRAQVTSMADAYNTALDNRQKTENKLFRVIMALNSATVVDTTF